MMEKTEAIKVFETQVRCMRQYCNGDVDCVHCKYKVTSKQLYNAMLSAIENLSCTDTGFEWHSMRKEKPPKEGRYLVTNNKWGAWDVDCDSFMMEKWVLNKNVTAWAFLPEKWSSYGNHGKTD